MGARLLVLVSVCVLLATPFSACSVTWSDTHIEDAGKTASVSLATAAAVEDGIRGLLTGLPAPAPVRPLQRAGMNVTINGTLSDALGTRPYLAGVAAVYASNYSIACMTYTMSGDYGLDVTNSTDYVVVVFALSANTAGGYSVHGYFPVGKYQRVENSAVRLDFTLRPGHDIIFEAYDVSGKLISENAFPNVRWSTGTGLGTDSAKAAFAVWTGCGNATGFTVPAVVIPPSEKRDFWVQWTCEGFGKVNLRLDNGSAGYFGQSNSGQVVNLNYELARSQCARALAKKEEYTAMGIRPSDLALSRLNVSLLGLADAVNKSGAGQARASDTCLNASLWALEALELDRAAAGIEQYRKGNLTVSVVDKNGHPLEGTNITINQTATDFTYGFFGQYRDTGAQMPRELKSIGLNLFTAGFYWSVVEPTEGLIDTNTIDNVIGVPALKDMGFTVKAHAPCYLINLVLPDYLKAKNFTELNQTVKRHVTDLVEAYGDRIDIWEVTNEASGTGANFGLPREQMIEIIKTSARAIREAKPDARILINNGFAWFGEQLSGTFFLEPGDNYTMAIPEFLDWLDAEGIDLDITGQQMYDGGFSTFMEDAGLGGGLGASTFEFSVLSEMMDVLGSYGRPVHITEQSVSGIFNSSPQYRDMGWWHSRWDARTQADFLTTFLTVLLSKPRAESFTWWDIDDRYPFMKGGGLFDASLKPKPVFYAWKDFIANHTTNTLAVSGEGGKTQLRAYGGNLSVRAQIDGFSGNATVRVREQTDNSVTVKIEDYEALPDLAIAPEDIAFNLSGHEETGTVAVNITVRNIGDNDAGPFRVRVSDGAGNNLSAPENIDGLGAGNSTGVGFVYDAPALSGAMDITIALDAGNTVREHRENNNNATATVTLTPVMWGNVEGCVTIEGSGRPATGAVVTASLGTGTVSSVTDGDGNFSFGRIQTGKWNITVDKTDCHIFNATLEVVPRETARPSIVLRPINNGTLAGTVVDSHGIAVPGANVRLAGAVTMSTVSGPDGNFSIENIPAGRYTLSATAPDFSGIPVQENIEGNRTLDVKLVLNYILGNLIGRVTDARTGAPVANATVRIPELGKGTVSTQNGSYLLSLIPAGRNTLTVSKAGYNNASLSVITTGGATTVQDAGLVPLEPERNGTVSGLVYEKNGTPLARATVRLAGTAFGTITGPDGRFELAGVPAGNYTLTAGADGKRTVNQKCTVRGGQTTALDVTLEKEAITGGGGISPALYGALAVFFVADGLVVFALLRRRKTGK